MKWDDLMYDQNFSPMIVYSQSKLANILFTRELVKKLIGTNVTTNSLHPGVVRTAFGQEFVEKYKWLKIVLNVFYPVIWLFMKSPEQGAQTTIYCAVE